MQRSTILKGIAILAVLAVVITVGVVGYIYAAGGSGQASAPISAPKLTASNGSQQVFRIDPSQSQVSFTLGEILMGSPNKVVGTTNQVAGDILVDLDHPASSSIGTIRIDARTLKTDSSMRDRMIRGPILQSSQDQYEFIQFVPTGMSGLPDKVVPGQATSIQIIGNLTVRHITHPETFTGTVTLTGDTPARLKGAASAQVTRADFNLQIPSVRSVANVDDNVQIDINFVANPVNTSTSSQPATQAATSAGSGQ